MTTNNVLNAPEPFVASIGGSGVASPTAHGVLIAEGASAFNPIVLGAGQVLIGTTASDPSAASLSAGTGVSISSTSGSITINAVGGALTWSTVTAGTSSPAVNSGTIANHASTPLVLTLPATAPEGSVIAVQGLAGSGGWTLTANTGQTIQFGNQSSTSGGSWSSTDPGDSMWVVCAVANTTWIAITVISAGLTKV